MALIKCEECGHDISDKAEICPNCGFPMYMRSKEARFQETHIQKMSSSFELNGIQFDVEEVKNNLFFQTVANTAKKVRKICKCEQQQAEEIVYGYFLSKHGEYTGEIEDLKEKIRHIKSYNGKKLYCPYCLSRNIDTKQIVSESVSKGKSEVRKKSAITRAGNKAGRAGMIMMTGGLWALTPKKSDYNEIKKGKTEYSTTIIETCMDCGMRIR